MPKLIWSVLCQQVIIDSETNQASYINTIEGLIATSFPVKMPPIFVGTLWAKSKNKDRIVSRIRIISPDEQTVYERMVPELEFEGKKKYRVNYGIGGADIGSAGDYTILIEQRHGDKWKTETRLPLSIETAEEIPALTKG